MKEKYFALTSSPAEYFGIELRRVWDELLEKSTGFKLVWVRFHLSDIANQYEELAGFLSGYTAAFSAVGQAPVNGGKIALEAWAVSSGELEVSDDGHCAELCTGGYKFLFFNCPFAGKSNSEAEMTEEFAQAEKLILEHGGTLENNLQRTWIYCRDIDNNYAGLVKARREFFAGRELSADTHFIASTGIEGKNYPYNRLVKMDSFALFGHEREQIVYLKALEHLSPTALYNVTFERAVKIIYGDRSHIFISGTASIDHEGKILYEKDIRRQSERMVENVAALLAEGGASLADLKQVAVYLRDAADREKVAAVLKEKLHRDLPLIMLSGSVCRPGWLVEMDAIAVTDKGNAAFKSPGEK